MIPTMTDAWRLRIALALIFVVPGFWTVNYLIARLYVGHIEAHMLALLRWTVAFSILLPFCWAEIRRGLPLRSNEKREFLLLGGLGMWICGAFVYIGGQTTSSVNIALLYAISPVLISLISARLLKEPFGWVQSVGVAMALIGMLWVVLKGDLTALGQQEFTPGDLWILVCVVSWTIYSLRLKAIESRFSNLARLTLITAGGMVVLIPFTLLEAALLENWNLTATGLWYVLLVGIFPGVGAYFCYIYMQQQIGAARTSVVLYLGPLYAALAGWALLGEQPQDFHAVGGVAILLGVYLVNRSPSATPQAKPA